MKRTRTMKPTPRLQLSHDDLAAAAAGRPVDGTPLPSFRAEPPSGTPLPA